MYSENETGFTNEEIDVHALPKYEAVSLMPLDGKYKMIMLINFLAGTLFFLFVVSIPALTVFYGEWQMFLLYMPVVIIQTVNYLLLNRIFENRRYAVRDKDIIYQAGFLNRRVIVVPYNRIQHAAIHESWLARKFSLAKIVLYTTGDSLSIPGLPLMTAQNIKTLVLEKIRGEDSRNKVHEMDDEQESRINAGDSDGDI